VNKQHSPQIKVMYDTGNRFNPHATVGVILKRDVTPTDVVGYNNLPNHILTPIRNYINLNFDVLIDYWNDKIDTFELTRKLKKL
jgi:hypothetical protein